MKVLLSNILKVVTFFLLICCNIIKVSAEPELGVAVEPMKLIIKPGKVTYFTVINETEREYIVTSKVISDRTTGGSFNKKFISHPPLKFLKKREHSVMGIIYLKEDEEQQNKGKYYLSISFIPRVSENRAGVSIPVILVHQIPLVFE